jgi:hypothetical protein
MSPTFANLRVGEPIRHKTLSVFPLFAGVHRDVEYRLADEALSDESVVVEEVSQSGTVSSLLVENKGGLRVLFLEGEELVGAKQNRVLNTSVLVAAHSKLKIPVSCVEQGRWGYKSRYFGSSGSHLPSKLRRVLKATVSRSIKEERGHASNQGEVWKEVASLHATHGVASYTSAMSDAFETYRDRLAEFRERLKYVEGATGMAVGVGTKIVAADLFDKPSTCRKVWDRLLSGAVLDALEAPEVDLRASASDVEQMLGLASDLRWELTDAVGEGVEYRCESPQGDHASALVFDDAVVHASLVAAV